MTARSATFEILGQPRPQGSMRSWRTKFGKIVTTHANAAVLMPWRQEIAAVAKRAWDGGPSALPISVTFVFNMKKPKSAKKSVVWPVTRPDADRLCRAVFDAMTGVCYHDDSQVVHVCATKVYADTPSAIITVKEME